MFTGIIEELGVVDNIITIKNGKSIVINASLSNELKIGDSVSINGACLTIVKINTNSFEVEVMKETLSKTNLEKLSIKDKVNLERALKLNDRLGGHLVTGHIDAVGEIKSRTNTGLSVTFEIRIPKEITKYLVEKGSIAVDGISLTVGNIIGNIFTVYIIPHTLKSTTLGFRQVGDSVNIETDLLAKYIEKLLVNYSVSKKESIITEDYLKNFGFR